MNWQLDPQFDVKWEYTGNASCNSKAETKTSTTTETTSISDSYNTTDYKVNNLSDIGNISLAPATAGNTTLYIVLAIVVIFGLLAMKRKV